MEDLVMMLAGASDLKSKAPSPADISKPLYLQHQGLPRIAETTARCTRGLRVGGSFLLQMQYKYSVFISKRLQWGNHEKVLEGPIKLNF